MPDLFTGEEELELEKAIEVFEKAVERGRGTANEIEGIRAIKDALVQTIEAEVPTPQMCRSCNDPALFAQTCTCCGNPITPEGRPVNEPNYLPLGGV